MYKVRRSCWETNSSTIQQLAIYTGPEDTPEDHYDGTTEVVLRLFDGCFSSLDTLQDRIDFIVSCCIGEGGPSTVYNIFTLQQTLDKIGVKYRFDPQSFVCPYWCQGIGEDITDFVTEDVIDNSELLGKFLFHRKSEFVEVDNNYPETLDKYQTEEYTSRRDYG